MKRVAAGIVLLILATSGFAGQHPNTAKGFNANSVYAVNGIDNINIFNGNLTLAIPIGPAFEIGGGVTYQLRLYSNGNLWSPEERVDLDDETSADCSDNGPTPADCIHAYPDRRANAGIGFTLSLGRLFPPEEQTNETAAWVYESPDGSEHRFDSALVGPVHPDDGTTFYTNDGTFLRMKGVGNRRTIEFPNGEKHTFLPVDEPTESATEPGNRLAPWILKTIGNQYAANELIITYTRSGGYITEAILSDGFRAHRLTYALFPFESGIEDMYSDPDPPVANHRMLVTMVELSGSYDGETFSAPESTYSFSYEQRTLGRPDWHSIPSAYAPPSATVQTLESLTLPDLTRYEFSYKLGGFNGQGGSPVQVVLPTGGKLWFEWGFRTLPVQSSDPHGKIVPAVIERKLYDRDGALLGTWTYAQTGDLEATATVPARESIVTVTDPLQNKVEHFFDISFNNTQQIGYGLPYTPKTRDTTQSRFLSTRHYAAGSSTPKRSTYVKYETNATGLISWDARQVASKTVYHDDSDAFLDVASSDYDWLGHYRQSTTTGTGIQPIVESTSYNIDQATSQPKLAPAPGSPWILNTFHSKTVTDGTDTLKSEYLFDTKGFLAASRANVDKLTGGRTPKDVITILTPDARGNVQREEVFGGDAASLSTATLGSFTPSLAHRVSRVDHEYPAPPFASETTPRVRRSRVYDSTNQPLTFYSADVDVDRSGKAKISRDTSGVATEFRYDSSGRLEWELPTARAWTKYVYPNFVSSNEIQVETYQPGTTTSTTVTPGTRIGLKKFLIDGIGRVTKEFVEMPGGALSRREFGLNALGWQMSVTELGTATPLPTTTFTYDVFGRVLTATAPDASVVTYDYTGIRQKIRSSKIATPLDPETVVSTAEVYDILGRLTRVSERSGPTTAAAPIGVSVPTDYTYDVAGRLVSVTMKQGSVLQQRLFDYDGRGFLRWESQPEKGVTNYTYDGRGSVLSKRQAAVPGFDLNYQYDAAGRLLTVSGQTQMLKQFTYATENAGSDLRKGKLLSATRFNHPVTPSDDPWWIIDGFKYEDAAGRLTSKTTRIFRDGPFGEEEVKSVTMSQSYNELDLPTQVKYPMCTGCGVPTGDTDRSLMTRTYDHGRLTALGGPGMTIVSAATFHPNGMRATLTHGNGVVDTQAYNGMARPSSLAFGTYKQCLQPAITTQPANTVSTGAGAAVTLSVVATGTGTLVYEWYNALTGDPVPGSGPSITVNPTSASQYYVRITGPCGIATSQVAVVSFGSCSPPSTGPITPTKQVDGSWILRPDPVTGANPTFTWRIQPANTVVGSQRELTVTITQSTSYTLTVSDGCGTSSATSVTINLPLTNTTTGLVATANGTSSVSVTWPAVSGATGYVLERKAGGAWVQVQLSTNSYTDNSVAADMTYAYRVKVTGSGNTTSAYSNTDVATTTTFALVPSLSTITAASVSGMLTAVNSVRLAAGWGPITWANILPPGDAPPAPGVPIRARHVLACRIRMNEALQALGVPAQGNVSISDLLGQLPKIADINEVYQRAQ